MHSRGVQHRRVLTGMHSVSLGHLWHGTRRIMHPVPSREIHPSTEGDRLLCLPNRDVRGGWRVNVFVLLARVIRTTRGKWLFSVRERDILQGHRRKCVPRLREWSVR